MKNNSNIKKYKILSHVYDSIMGIKIFRTARKKAISLLPLKSNDEILLVGVGTGEDLQFLPENVLITGIDLSNDMLKVANKKINCKNVNLLQMNAEDLEFSDKTFNCVILNLILSVAENPKDVMKEALRVLTDDGIILIFDKFLENNKPSFIRSLLNIITSSIGTDINRNLDDILYGLPLVIIREENSILNGNYKIILVKKVVGK
ncbi:MAG: hypothetical protein K0S34_2194 [Bacillales bacterium]|jgi:ubiquinone/menaquinone biosynthesis C-methylase UbiE|nr:hypothetical protein [Bacillales bacterium]